MSDPKLDSNTQTLSLERARTFKFLKNNDLLVTSCIPGEKAPNSGWKPVGNTVELSRQLMNRIEYTNDNVAVHLAGVTVDIDIDTDSVPMINALERFLPHCSHIWGRGDRLRTHRLYNLSQAFDSDQVPILRNFKRLKMPVVEIRGGSAGKGNYSLMPGSVHPSGDLYTWDRSADINSSVSVTTANRLSDAIRKSTLVGILAPYWTEGYRQELVMALAGAMYRAKSLSEELDVDGTGFCMGYDDAYSFVEVLLDLVDEDPADTKMRLKAFTHTWNKSEKGLATTGASTLERLTGDTSIIAQVYACLVDSSRFGILDDFMSTYGILDGTGDFIEINVNDRPKVVRTVMGMRNGLGHLRIDIGGKAMHVLDVANKSRHATRISKRDFVPGGPNLVETPDGLAVNVYVKPQIDPWPNPVTDEEVAPFLHYTENCVATNEDDRKWIMAWIADIFQEPSKKPRTAAVLVGKPGTGKSTLGKIVGKILGQHSYNSFNNVASVVQKHNTQLEARLLIQMDEALALSNKPEVAVLKSLITDDFQQIEPKGFASYSVPNFARYLFTSNMISTAVAVIDGNADRRYSFFSMESVMSQKYWTDFNNWLELPDSLSKIHRWLLDYKYDKALISKVHDNAARTKTIVSTASGSISFVGRVVSERYPIALVVHTKSYQSAKDDDDFGALAIDRTSWPKYVEATAFHESFSKGTGFTASGTLTSRTVQDLKDLELLVDTVEGEYVDITRDSTQVKGFAIYYEVAPFEKWEEVWKTNTGNKDTPKQIKRIMAKSTKYGM